MTNIPYTHVIDTVKPPVTEDDLKAAEDFTIEEARAARQWLGTNRYIGPPQAANTIKYVGTDFGYQMKTTVLSRAREMTPEERTEHEKRVRDFERQRKAEEEAQRKAEAEREEAERRQQEQEWRETPHWIKDAAPRLEELGISASIEDKKLYLISQPQERVLVRVDKGYGHNLTKLLGGKPPNTVTLEDGGSQWRVYRANGERDIEPTQPADGIAIGRIIRNGIPVDSVTFSDLADLPPALYNVDPIPAGEGPFDRGKLIRLDPDTVDAEYAVPDWLYDNLLYRGRIHSFYGTPGSGKSYAAQEITLDLTKRGHTVVYIDQEKGGRDTIARLKGMGLTADDQQRLIVYPAPNLDMDDAAQFRQFMAYLKPSLIVWDNLTAVLFAAGIDENRNGPVTGWYDAFVKPLRELDVATLLIDHPGKDGSQRAAIAKLSEVDVRHRVTQGKPFNRHKTGQILFSCDKDAPAVMPKQQFTYDAGGPEAIFRQGVAGNDQKLLAALADGMTRRELIEAAEVNEQTGYRNIRKLVDSGDMIEEDGALYRAS